MVADTELTNVFYDHWSHEDKQEYLDALDGAIAEIKELGPETYGKRTLEKLKEMRANCKDGILQDIEDDGVCPKCGAYMDYNDRYGEYVCPECGCKYSDSHDCPANSQECPFAKSCGETIFDWLYEHGDEEVENAED